MNTVKIWITKMPIISMQKKRAFSLFLILLSHFSNAMEKNIECTDEFKIEFSELLEKYKETMRSLDSMTKYSEDDVKSLLDCTKKSFQIALNNKKAESTRAFLEYGIFMSITLTILNNDYTQITSNLLVEALKTKEEWSIYYKQLIPLLLNKNKNATDLFNEVCYKSLKAYTWFNKYAYELAKGGNNPMYLKIIDEIFNSFEIYFDARQKKKTLIFNHPLPNLDGIQTDQGEKRINQVTISSSTLNTSTKNLNISDDQDRVNSDLSMTKDYCCVPILQGNHEEQIILSKNTYPISSSESKRKDDSITAETRTNFIPKPHYTRIYRDRLLYTIDDSDKDDLLDISLSPTIITRILYELGPENQNLICRWYVYHKTLYTSHATEHNITLKIDLNSSKGLAGKKEWFKRKSNKTKFFLFILDCDSFLKINIMRLNKKLDGKIINI